MALRLIRRHLKDCPHTSTRYRRCKCPIHVYGTLAGEKIRKALDQTSWEAATDQINAWTAAGEIGLVKIDPPTVREAVAKYLADCEARHLGWEAMRKYRHLLEDRLIPWADQKGFLNIRHVSVDALRQFRQTWTDSPLYATKNLERLRAFFRFCHQAGWTKDNPAKAVKPPKVTQTPTLPFSRDEMKSIVDACDKYRGAKERMKAFVLVMRYTGLRIADTIRLSTEHVVDGRVFVRTAKTGQPVTVPVPPQVIDALTALDTSSGRYFWTGKNIRSAVSNWSRYLGRIFELAKVEGGHSHRFRDTCAVELLLAGASVEDVATILGNTPQHAIRSLAWPVVEEHDDAGFVQKQTPDEVVAHRPQHRELVDGVVPLERGIAIRSPPSRGPSKRSSGVCRLHRLLNILAGHSVSAGFGAVEVSVKPVSPSGVDA